MNFLWPQFLWMLLALPLLALGYRWLLRRRGKPTLRVSSLDLVRAAGSRSWRRHVPPALMLLACVLLVIAMARPAVTVTLPWVRTTIMLAIDVSRSMRVTDVEPSRMEAAQDAARMFLSELPRHIDVGVVTFAGTAQVAQQATLDREVLVKTIDAFQMQFGTAIGSAIVVCLAELFPDHGIRLEDMTFGPRALARGSAPGRDGSGGTEPRQITPVAPGSHDAAAIILLSDGRRTTGVDTLQAARMAADRGVRIHVVGLGTPDGHVNSDEGMAIYLKLDEPTLREVARLTGGEYHHAGTAEMLRSVYKHLGSQLQTARRETEVTGLLTLFAALLVATAALLSLIWFGRVE